MTPDDTTPAEAAQAAEAAWSTYYEKNNRCRKAFIAGYLSAAPLIAARAAATQLQRDIQLAIKVHAAHCLACESPDRDRSNEHPPGLVLRGSFADLLAAQDTPPTTTTEETP